MSAIEYPDSINISCAYESDKAVYLELENRSSEDERDEDTAAEASELDDESISFIEDETSNDETLALIETEREKTADAVPVTSSEENPGKLIKSLTCEICDIPFRTQEQIDNHLKEHYDQSCKQCEICSNILDTALHSTHLEIHKKAFDYRVKTKYRKVQCNVCRKFVSKNYIKTHMNLHIEDGAERFSKCKICYKEIGTTYMMRHLEKIHKKNVKHKPETESQRCPICEKFYKSNLFKEHLAGHNRKLKQYICEQCGKEFKYPTALKTHILTHNQELKYKCQFCDYQGLHMSLLKIHIRTHTKDYVYKCSKCGKTFITKSNLIIHERRHEKPSKYSCSDCNKCFHTEKTLTKHYNLIHLNIRDHQCEICGKSFGDNKGLLAHQKKMHNQHNTRNRVGRTPSYLLKRDR